MAFNSLDFALFLPLVLLGYAVCNWRAQNVWLLVASYVFYGWWDWRFLSLIVLSTVADYLISQQVATKPDGLSRKRLLWLSLTINLGLLATFKYFNFFVDSFIDLGLLVGLNLDTPALRLIPPVGISFYTFQTLSYTIDVYRREIKPERNFITFALFVSYFPQLVAGPIERASRLLPQFNAPREVTVDCLRAGLVLILIGLFKKVVVADSAGVEVNTIFADVSEAGSATLLAGAVLFTLQIYGDFSGYSNIARGVSRLLGFRLVENFKTPYLARNISEFWRRWHISLSEWLRDYLYISLGGNKGGTWRTLRNLMATMLLGGLWHGAAWTFVVWGFLHGLYLCVHRLWRYCVSEHRWMSSLWYTVCSVLLTYTAVCAAFVVFRAESMTQAVSYLTAIMAFRGGFDIGAMQLPVLLTVLLLPIEILQYKHGGDVLAVRQRSLLFRSLLYVGMAICILMASHQHVPFIYFQF